VWQSHSALQELVSTNPYIFPKRVNSKNATTLHVCPVLIIFPPTTSHDYHIGCIDGRELKVGIHLNLNGQIVEKVILGADNSQEDKRKDADAQTVIP